MIYDASGLRRAFWGAVQANFACAHGGSGRLRSAYGRDYEILSSSKIVPLAREQTHGAVQIINRLIDELVQALDVERPGGVLVVKGTASDDPNASPCGIVATIAPLGTVAAKGHLAIHAHALPLEEARAYARTLARATL